MGTKLGIIFILFGPKTHFYSIVYALQLCVISFCSWEQLYRVMPKDAVLKNIVVIL